LALRVFGTYFMVIVWAATVELISPLFDWGCVTLIKGVLAGTIVGFAQAAT